MQWFESTGFQVLVTALIAPVAIEIINLIKTLVNKNKETQLDKIEKSVNEFREETDQKLVSIQEDTSEQIKAVNKEVESTNQLLNKQGEDWEKKFKTYSLNDLRGQLLFALQTSDLIDCGFVTNSVDDGDTIIRLGQQYVEMGGNSYVIPKLANWYDKKGILRPEWLVKAIEEHRRK